jgi:hypothetical protein
LQLLWKYIIMEQEFKVNDRVIYLDDWEAGTVISTDESGCDVLWDNGEETWIEYWQIKKV